MRKRFVTGCCLALLLLNACGTKEEQAHRSKGPKVVEGKGYVVPKDSLAEPQVIEVDEDKLRTVTAGNPDVVPAHTNVHPVESPQVIAAGSPKVVIPGQDSFPMPKNVPAKGKVVPAGAPEIVIAKDMDSKDLNPANFSYFGKLHGLKHDGASCIFQDEDGNLWFGTNGGVTKYDGKSFYHYTESEGLSDNRVFSILQDNQGNMWFGTWGGGVTMFDGRNFTHFTKSENFFSNHINHVYLTKDGNIWFAGREGFSRYQPSENGQSASFTHFAESEDRFNIEVNHIYQDRDGNIWFCTEGRGLLKYQLSDEGKEVSFTRFTESEGLSNNNILEMTQDRDGNYWIATWGGGITKYYRPKKDQAYSFAHYTEASGFGNNLVSDVFLDSSGDLWFATRGAGLAKYESPGYGRPEAFKYYTETEGFTSLSINDIYQDRDGQLWFAYHGGVAKYNGALFTFPDDREGISEWHVYGIIEDQTGDLWIAGWGALSKFDGNSFTLYTEEEGLFDKRIYGIARDQTGNLWLATWGGGVIKFIPPNAGRAGSFTQFTETDGLSRNSLNCAFIDNNGNLWFGTNGSGVTKYQPPRDGKSGFFTHLTRSEGLSHNNVSSVLQDRAGNYWFGTEGGGVTKYEPPGDETGPSDLGTFTHYNEAGGLGSNIVTSLFQDKDGDFWFGTVAGVTKFEPKDEGVGGIFTHFTEAEGLSNKFVFSILQDRDGDLWFGTRFGLNCLSAEKLVALSDRNGANMLDETDVLFKQYSYEDGFLGIGCNRGGLFEDRDGTIWIGSNTRLTAYHPDGDIGDAGTPNIQFTGLQLFNEKVSWRMLNEYPDTSILLNNGVRMAHVKFDSLRKWHSLPHDPSFAYNNNYLTFDYVGITMNQPRKVNYQYRLEGMDDGWSAVTLRNSATYGNLPHGRYTFRVKAMGSTGRWSDEIQYPFTIRPPWWNTSWAYGLYALILIASIWQVHRIQRARTIRAEREKRRARELEQAKEIEKAYERLKSTQAQLVQSEKMAALGEMTAGIAHEIQNPLNFVNNFSEVNQELLDEMTQAVREVDYQQIQALAENLRNNEAKINYHGKRADGIVKSMLQHSRGGRHEKELTDLNVLCDEYLRLAYHGLRARDKSFNAEFRTELDESLQPIAVVPQDIGRVLLNLINNAFQATKEKQTDTAEVSDDGSSVEYKPEVVVSTKQAKDHIEISVKDNGSGIPEALIGKVFQPFFTTKATGEGTGLGLSMAFDIVTKGHGGDLLVRSEQCKGTEFVIKLPV